MEYITYKQFEREMNKRGYDVVLNDYYQVFVQDEYGMTIIAVDKTKYKALDLYWNRYESLTDEEKDLVADPCWQLASTPLEDREELKRYFYIVKPEYRYLFPPEEIYLNHVRVSNRFSICTISNDDDWRTEFNEKECKILESDYNLSLFEKVEVE